MSYQVKHLMGTLVNTIAKTVQNDLNQRLQFLIGIQGLTISNTVLVPIYNNDFTIKNIIIKNKKQQFKLY